MLERALARQVAERVDGPVLEPDAGEREPQLAAVHLDRDRVDARRPPRLGRDGNERRVLGEAGQRLGCRTTDDIRGGKARDCLGGLVPEPDDAVGVDEHHAVADRRKHARSLRALLRLAEQARVVDRRRRPARDLLGEHEIFTVEDAARLRSDERERAEHPAA